MRWSEYWTGVLSRRLIRHLLAGGPGDALQPSWLPRRWVTVVHGDIDHDAGVGVLSLVSRPGREHGAEYTLLLERCDAEWRSIGGGGSSGGRTEANPPRRRPAVGGSGQPGMIELGGGAGSVSHAHRSTRPKDWLSSSWVGSSHLRVAAEVDHLLVGERRIEVPEDGRLVVAWKSPQTMFGGGVRPCITAIGRDGAELSVVGPHDQMDSYTWALLRRQGD